MSFKIQYTKAFLKQYKRLQPNVKTKAKKSINKFIKNPKDHTLNTHKLNGVLENRYSFSIDYDYLVIFEINKENKSFIFLKLGNHAIYR